MSGTDGLALATRGLRKNYGSRRALNGLDLSVPTGVVYGFLGPNGAGKTTTMRVLTGLVHSDGGTVELLGKPFKRGDRRRLFEVGALVESPTFYPFLSGRANLRELAAAGAPVPARRIDELLDLMGLADRAGDKVQNYSMGMKQRLGIAGALLNDPKLLLLDEPANGLDPAGIVAMRDTLKTLASLGKTVFISSHLLAEVQVMADVVGIIAAGKLVREGPLKELLSLEGLVKVRVRPSLVDGDQDSGSARQGRAAGGNGPRGRAGCRFISPPIALRTSTRCWPARAFSRPASSRAQTWRCSSWTSRAADGSPRAKEHSSVWPDQSTGKLAAPRRKGDRGMRLFFSGMRKLIRRPATWVTFGLLVGSTGPDRRGGRSHGQQQHGRVRWERTRNGGQGAGHIPGRI
jgi:ABC-type multidrug transport system ATPase subunit